MTTTYSHLYSPRLQSHHRRPAVLNSIKQVLARTIFQNINVSQEKIDAAHICRRSTNLFLIRCHVYRFCHAHRSTACPRMTCRGHPCRLYLKGASRERCPSHLRDRPRARQTQPCRRFGFCKFSAPMHADLSSFLFLPKVREGCTAWRHLS